MKPLIFLITLLAPLVSISQYNGYKDITIDMHVRNIPQKYTFEPTNLANTLFARAVDDSLCGRALSVIYIHLDSDSLIDNVFVLTEIKMYSDLRSYKSDYFSFLACFKSHIGSPPDSISLDNPRLINYAKWYFRKEGIVLDIEIKDYPSSQNNIEEAFRVIWYRNRRPKLW